MHLLLLQITFTDMWIRKALENYRESVQDYFIWGSKCRFGYKHRKNIQGIQWIHIQLIHVWIINVIIIKEHRIMHAGREYFWKNITMHKELGRLLYFPYLLLHSYCGRCNMFRICSPWLTTICICGPADTIQITSCIGYLWLSKIKTHALKTIGTMLLYWDTIQEIRDT